MENMARTGGPMTECRAAPDKKFKECKYFGANTGEPDRCRYCAFDEYCINVRAYLEAKGVDPQIIDTVN